MPRDQVGFSSKDGAKIASLATGWGEVSRETAVAQLSKILDSLQFRSSKRCSTFLRHVVEHAVDGYTESLKERSLGVDVFGRDPNYDTNQDPVVRSTAGEVRKRLAQYYLEAGHRDEIRISLPPGSYNPEIHPSPERTVSIVAPPIERTSRRWRWIAMAGIAVAASVAAILLTPMFRRTDLDRFWAPLVEPSSPIVVCVGQPRAYKVSSGGIHQMEAWNDKSAKGESPPSISSADVKPVWDRDVSLVDAQAMLPLCQLLTRKGKKVEIRGARASSLADLRGRACIFVGAFNNDWTMRLNSDMRFYFDRGPDESMVIRDRQDATRKDWAGPRNWPAPVDQAADYAIVTRVFNPTIEQTIVSVAGASGFGTYAAGEFLANEEYFAAALREAPRDWYRKNIEVVLSVKVISGTPGPPKVLAAHFW
jgi:hypothetical protein